MRKWLVAWLILLWSGVLPVAAQTTPWSAWLYNASNGSMTLVSSEGAVLRELTLPTAAGHLYPPLVGVSRDGQVAAYITANVPLNASRLALVNLQDSALMGDYIITDLAGSSFDLYTTPLMFDENSQTAAIGLLMRDGTWRIILFTTSGTIRAELRSDDPAVAGVAIPNQVVPVARRYENNQIAFTMQPLDNPGAELGSYLWNITDGTVVENTLYPGLDNDILSTTGEIIMPLSDFNLPNNDPVFAAIGGQQNTLQVYDPTADRRFPFYNHPDRSLGVPHFIQNGERILTGAVDAGGNIAWSVIERDGRVVGEIPVQIADIFGLADGFIYLTPTNPALLAVVNTRDGLDSGTPLGQSTPDARIRLVWAGDSAVSPQPPTYTAWFDLSNTLVAAQATQLSMPTPIPENTLPPPTATPIVTPTDEPFYVAPSPVFIAPPAAFQSRLSVGMRAIVTEQGNFAQLSTQPDGDAPALVLLYTDMVVEVLDGPQITDGFIWWRVRALPRGDVGWAIEGANGESWLIPEPIDGTSP